MARVLDNIDYYAKEISEMLLNKTYIPSPYSVCQIYDGINKKERTIYKPKFYPDQIVQWAIMLQIQPIIMRGMYHYSCGSIPNRGIHYGKKYVEALVQHKFKETKYFLQLDIKKFYPSIKIPLLMEFTKTKIKDKDVLDLLSTIFALENCLPIGILLSQWFSNFFLEDLDHFIKEKLGVKYFVRYVDDMILFGNNKKKLHKIKLEIDEFLKRKELQLKGNWQVNRTDDGIDFLGFRFFRDRTILRKSLMLRISKSARKFNKRPTTPRARRIISYLGWIKHSDSHNFYMERIDPFIDVKKVKRYAKGNYT